MSDLDTTIRSWVERMAFDIAGERERQIRLALQPKPRWLPTWVWHRLIARLLVIEESVTTGKEPEMVSPPAGGEVT